MKATTRDTDSPSDNTPGAIIKALKAGEFAVVGKLPQGGALQARRLAGGAVMLYWRYRPRQDRSRRHRHL